MKSSAMGTIARVLWAWALLGALAYAGSTCAQATRVTDLGISATLTPSGPLQPGSTARLVLTFTNNGPEAAPSVGGVSSAYPFLDFEIFALVPAQPQPCAMQFDDFIAPRGQPSFLVAAVIAGSLPASATRVCTLDLIVAPTATGSIDLSFRVNDGQVFITDANPANDSVQFRLTFASAFRAESIPTAGWPAWLLLIAGLLVGGMIEGRRRSG